MDMTSNHQFSIGGVLGIAAAALLSVLLSACAAGPQCAELGDCGGDPTGTWSSDDATHPGCVDGPYFTQTTVTAAGAAFDPTLYGRPAPVAGQSPAQPTLADWCEGLVLQKDRTNILGGRVTFVFQDPAITKFSVVYNPDLTYTAGFVRSGRFAQYYSETCLTEFGQDPNDCSAIQATIVMEDLTGQLKNPTCTPAAGGGCSCAYDSAAGRTELSGQALTCKVSEIIMNREGTNETFKNVACTPDLSRGGCNCGYDAAFANGDIGVYTVSGNVITNHPQNSADYPSKITFCQQNDSLQISGFQSSYLYNKAPVRTFRLNRDSNAAPPVMMEMGGAPAVAGGGTGGDSAGTGGAAPAMGTAGMGTAGTGTAGMGGM
jgi:hypothetical protein